VPEPTLLPGVVDHHVHLGLVDREQLSDGPITEVHDLGWVLSDVQSWAADPPPGVKIRYAGPFHTAIGGYPSGRVWAPDRAVVQLRHRAEVRGAVEDAVGGGVSAIKIALHADMPVLSDDLLEALVTQAHASGLPAIVHAEGAGQAQRAIAAGADTLVHTPWTERLTDEQIKPAITMTWISTLAIHEGESLATAIDNLARFHALGGSVRYGTDMGNGPNPVGPNAAEIELLEQAGISGEDLLTALTGENNEPALVSDHPRPRNAKEVIEWLAHCKRL
jgi:imidazolonepropionase-like amidohydrolase